MIPDSIEAFRFPASVEASIRRVLGDPALGRQVLPDLRRVGASYLVLREAGRMPWAISADDRLRGEFRRRDVAAIARRAAKLATELEAALDVGRFGGGAAILIQSLYQEDLPPAQALEDLRRIARAGQAFLSDTTRKPQKPTDHLRQILNIGVALALHRRGVQIRPRALSDPFPLILQHVYEGLSLAHVSELDRVVRETAAAVRSETSTWAMIEDWIRLAEHELTWRAQNRNLSRNLRKPDTSTLGT